MGTRIFILFVIAVLCSCGGEKFYEKKIVVSDPWPYDSLLHYSVDVADTAQLYKMELLIEHSPEFSFENFYFKVHTSFPSKDDREELLNVDLASRAGQWVGNCSGEICKVKVFMLDRFKFPEPGQYGFSFEQYTREEELEGVQGLTLSILNTSDESE